MRVYTYEQRFTNPLYTDNYTSHEIFRATSICPASAAVFFFSRALFHFFLFSLAYDEDDVNDEIKFTEHNLCETAKQSFYIIFDVKNK